jgi:O-antigen ligase
MSSDIINRRVRGEDYGSALSRIPMIQIALNLIEAHPVGGVGLNNYAVVMGEYDNTILGRRYKSIHRPVHNTYLLIAGETGILGLAAFLLLVFSIAAVLLRAMRSDDALHSLFALALACGFTAFFLHGLVDKHSPGGNPLFYLLLSLCAVLSHPSALRPKGEARC